MKFRTSPLRRFSNHKPRSLGGVHPDLAAAFRGLLCGELPWPLFVHGLPGRGKTCAALALCDHVSRSRYTTARDLVGKVMASFGTREAFDWKPWQPVADEDCEAGKFDRPTLLVLDEVGVRQTVTDTHYETVQRVLDDWETYPLVVVSNLDGAGLTRVYDDRIASRCEAGTIVELTGPDRRTA